MNLERVQYEGLDYDSEHWYCSGCNIMSLEICRHMQFKHVLEHFGKPMEEIPEHRRQIHRTQWGYNGKAGMAMDSEKSWPNPLPKKGMLRSLEIVRRK